MGLGRCLSGYKQLLLLQRTGVLLPAPISGSSQLPLTLVQGISRPFPAPAGTCVHVHTHSHRHTYTYILQPKTLKHTDRKIAVKEQIESLSTSPQLLREAGGTLDIKIPAQTTVVLFFLKLITHGSSLPTLKLSKLALQVNAMAPVAI